MEERIKCPRCGFVQEHTQKCRKCGIHISRYLELQKSRRIVPRKESQKYSINNGRQRDKRPLPETSMPLYHKKDAPSPKTQNKEHLKDEKSLSGDKILGIGELFEDAWEIYKRRIGTLIALYLLTGVFILIPIGIFGLIGYLFSQILYVQKEALISAGIIVGSIGGFITGFWGYGAFICAVVDENLSIRDALDSGWQKVGSFIWLFLLLGHIICGGFLLFFIPGLLFLVWFVFAQFILPGENEKGMNAILKSKEYVRGYGFEIFLRLFIIWLASLGISLIPLLGYILSLLFFPFEMIFIFLIYKDIKSIKGDITYISTTGEKFKWIGISTLGFIIAPLIIIAIMGATFVSSLYYLKEMLAF